MKIYKITYRGLDIEGNWQTKYSLRYGNTEDEAIENLDIDSEIIKVEFLGYKKGTSPKPLNKK